MIPQLALLGPLVTTYLKPLLIVAAFGFTFYAGYNQGQKAEIRKQVEDGVAAVVEERKEAKVAVKQATTDAVDMADLRNENEELREQLAEATAAGTCIANPDELRVLGEIADRTRLNN